MKLLRHILLAGLAGMMLTFALPEKEAQANDYWDSYWNWYDGSYRPYYYRRHRYRSPYNYGYYGYDTYNYNYNYYSPYGYGYYGRPYNSVQIGPLRFGWR